MADKKYQIFVSSTYEDLKEERMAVLNEILDMGHIPAGMQNFPAIGEEQMSFIQRVIDESDYYVLILAARYGSVDDEGISYTEREYDYAVKQGKKVIALIHANPDKIERGKTDKDEELYKKFVKFRKKVMGGRLVSFWESTTELVSKFQSSLIQTINLYPENGWIKGVIILNSDIQQKIKPIGELEIQNINNKNKELLDKNNELENKNNELENKNNELENKNNELENKNNELENKNNELENKNNELENKNNELENKNNELENKNNELENKNNELENKNNELENKNNELKYNNNELVEKFNKITNVEKAIEKYKQLLYCLLKILGLIILIVVLLIIVYGCNLLETTQNIIYIFLSFCFAGLLKQLYNLCIICIRN